VSIKFSKKKWIIFIVILSLLLGMSIYQFILIKNHHLKLSFLNIGQGDAILIQTSNYKNILIDAGPNAKVVEELSKKLNFFNQKIDLFIMTHPDADHYAGILDVFQKYPIQSVIMTGITVKNQLYTSFQKELKKRHIPVLYSDNTKDIQIGPNLYLDLLYPFKGESLIGQNVKNRNDHSIGLMLRRKNKQALALLTGDAEEEEETELLLSGQDFESPIFKLGHHGSRTSNSQKFLNAIHAKNIVISAGKDNKFHHPHPETLKRVEGLNIFSTTNGTVHFDL